MSNSLCRVRLFANHYFARFPVCAHSDRAHAGIFFSILIPPSLICGYYLQTRSGAVFSPYELANVLPARVFCLEFNGVTRPQPTNPRKPTNPLKPRPVGAGTRTRLSR